ncbi:MAG: hypothetical protein QNJ00_16855 [Woeseiaceae bacterium]|nr:hypothetical protein [Woeseiaceae bacterium]
MADEQPQTDDIRLTIPAIRRLPVVLFYTVVLYFLGSVQIMMVRNLLSGHIDPVFLVGTVVSTFACILIAGFIAWLVAGEEVIVADSNSLSLRQQAFGIGRTKRYDAVSIRTLRALPDAILSHDPITPIQELGARTGLIAFNYGNMIVAFGQNLDETEARSIVKRLKPLYPQ